MKSLYEIKKPDISLIHEITRSMGCSPIFATILANRNILTKKDNLKFFKCSFGDIRHPLSLKDIDISAERICKAITDKEKVLIFGDYDVDGITATVLLVEFFQYVGVEVAYHIPHRLKEGYSLKVNHIFDIAEKSQIDLIITVDCGSDSHSAVEAAKTAGIDLIITDHHTVPEVLPDAYSIVNPKRKDCHSGLENLAGVGVAFYLLIAVRIYLREMKFWERMPEPNLMNMCDLVAIGTVADIVPLVDENRIFVKAGINILNSNKRPGLTALVNECKINNPVLNSEDISFRLAPRLNAAGRMDNVEPAFKLLTSKSKKTAKEMAKNLGELNTKRQHIEKEMYNSILDYLTSMPHLLQKKAIILTNNNWHEGILGIIASRLVRKFFKPVVLISRKNGVGKGSARSISGFNLYEGLFKCSEILEKFGGHRMAAGLEIKTENIEQFRDNFENVVENSTTPEDFKPKLIIDYELGFEEISDKLMDELESLQPFGSGNREPLFLAKNVHVSSATVLGKTHRRMVLNQFQNRSKKINAIHFNVDSARIMEENFDRIIFKLRWNRWNNKKSKQILIEEVSYNG